MKYYKAVVYFFKNVISQYFSHSDITPVDKSSQQSESRKAVYKEKSMMINKNHDKEKKSDKKMNASDQNAQNQKYWKHVIRKILYQCMFLITPPNGLLSQYIQVNAINYINASQLNENDNPHKQELEIKSVCPINFKLTKSILTFTKQVFEIPDKFTKYVFIEELMLFYIRTHYISFVRLYNKNFLKTNKPQISKEASLSLCKKHLECLFAISNNRNDDTRRKLYQFKIVQFLCQEIQLEYEIQQRREQFLLISNQEQQKQHTSNLPNQQSQEEQKKEEKPQQIQAKPKPMPFMGIPKLNVAGLGLTEINENKSNMIQPEQKKEEQSKAQIGVPMLKLGSLGLSNLVLDNNDNTNVQTQDQPSKSEEQQNIIEPQQKKQLGFKIPALKVQGLGFSDLKQDSPEQKQQIKINTQQEMKQVEEESQATQQSKMKVPLLKIGGLGLSGLVKDNNEKVVDMNQVQGQNIQISKTIGYDNKEELFQKQPQFENTAPLKFKQEEENKQAKMEITNEDYQQLALVSQESAQFMSQMKNNQHNLQFVSEDQIDETKKDKLRKIRKNLIPPRNRNPSTHSQEENEVLFEKNKSFKDRGQDEGKKSQMGAYSNYRNSLQSMMTPNTQLRVESVMEGNNSNINSPNNMNAPNSNQLGKPSSYCHTPNEDSDRSNGSYVGKNKVYVPFLKFPEDIHDDPADKVVIYQRPDDNRFKLMKSKENNVNLTPEKQDHGAQLSGHSRGSGLSNNSKGKVGKRGKLLDLGGITQKEESKERNDNSNQNQMNLQIDQTLTIPTNQINQPSIKLNSQNVSQDNTIQASQQVKDLNKKIMIPLIKIPEKIEQPEGKDKIKLQLDLQDKLNTSSEAGNLTKLEMSLNQSNPKFQLLLDKNKDASQKNKDIKLPNKKTQDIQVNQSKVASLSQSSNVLNYQALLSEEMFYLKERSARPIYQDEELHILMVSLIMSLLLKPQRGTLDDLYCSQYPIDNGKQNILYLLHYHLNHCENIIIIPELQKTMQTISSPLAGHRLLKLLCASLFDLSMYNNRKDWKKLGSGAYAVVYECKLNIIEPQTVAIKEMMIPNTIYKRCVLHDIFTEITCLEEFRLEPCVTDLYDYGVDGVCYYIIMKKYSSSLRDWRLKQQKPFIENLSLYLSVYKEILKSIASIHSHNVTHYDIKCDNVLIDFGNSQGSNSLSKWAGEDEDRIRITIGDFGECKMFQSEQDEFCSRNRGTDYIKSPEMLQLAVNTRKDTDKYDRRRQVGTNRLSDIWSLGCLLFELLTGEFLFHSQDYIAFYMRVTKTNEQLLTNEKLEKISNNVYLIDFLKYMLVRDPKLRPPIESVLKRFEHVHALLVSTSSANGRFSLISPNYHQMRGQTSLDSIWEQIEQIMKQNSQVFGGEIKEENMFDQDQILNVSDSIQQIDEGNFEMKAEVTNNFNDHLKFHQNDVILMKIMSDVFISTYSWIKKNQTQAIKNGITHLVIERKNVSQNLRDKFDILEVPDFSEVIQPHNQIVKVNPFLLMPIVMDFLRKCVLQKGKVLFIEDSNVVESQCNGNIKFQLLRETLLVCLTSIFQTNAYEAFTLIRSQNPFFTIFADRLATISKWSLLTAKIKNYTDTFPKFSCVCGCCVITLKRQYANYNNIQMINCSCNQFYKNIETSQCPSPGCNEYIQYQKQFFKANYDYLQWGFLDGPSAQQDHQSYFLSQGVTQNSILVSIVEKRASHQLSNHNNLGNQSKEVDFNLISKSSATTKNYWHQGGSSTNVYYQRWKLFKCKNCHSWTHAVNEVENTHAILLNNRVKDSQINKGILNSKKSSNKDIQEGVRVPILEKIKLQLPF